MRPDADLGREQTKERRGVTAIQFHSCRVGFEAWISCIDRCRHVLFLCLSFRIAVASTIHSCSALDTVRKAIPERTRGDESTRLPKIKKSVSHLPSTMIFSQVAP
jgi:hypothetical protein